MNQQDRHVLTLRRNFTPEDELCTVAVPFEVHGAMDELSVHMEVVAQTEATPDHDKPVIDLGLADPLRTRGWSGGARNAFSVGREHATPGYLAGPLPEGTWSVLLGAYHVPPGGCTVTLTVSLVPSTSRWVKGDLHMHTFHSDGQYSPEETLRMVEALGLDFIALTDHNTVSQNRCFPASDTVVFIPGTELTTYKGHANLLGAVDPLQDFRVTSLEDARRVATEGHHAGAKVVLNHPFEDMCLGCDWTWGFDWNYDWVEVWNGPWRPANMQALAWWQEQLVAGRRLVAVGGSDTHGPHPYVRHGMPTTWVLSESHTVDGILEGIDKGHVFLSWSPEGPQIGLTCGDALMGEVVSKGVAGSGAAGPGATESNARVTIHVTAAKAGDTVRLITDRGVEEERTVQAVGVKGEGTVEAVADLHLDWDATGRKFCRVEVWRFFDEVQMTLMAAMSNPIYFGTLEED